MTTTRRCPNCGSDYLNTVDECIDCGVELVEVSLDDDGNDIEAASSGDDTAAGSTGDGASWGTVVGGQVVYELHEWSGESRMLLDQLVVGAGVVRAWEGSTLVVDVSLQDQVDELIEHVESAADSPLDPDVERVVYEVGSWTADQLTVLTDALVEAHIAYEFDVEGDVAVAIDDEDRVEALLDELDFGTAESAEADGEDEDPDDGLETAAILSDLFVACDRLQKDATDHEGVLGVVAAADKLGTRSLPFGYTPSLWKGIVDEARALRDQREDDTTDDPTIEEHARELRAQLRDYV